MTWAPGPIGDDSSAELYAAVRELAARSVDMLEEVAAGIEILLPKLDLDAEIPADVLEDLNKRRQQVVDLRGHRQELIDTCRLHLELLTREAVEELRAGFRLANLAGDEHRAQRQKITEDVAGHPVARLAELTADEAVRLDARLRELEEKF